VLAILAQEFINSQQTSNEARDGCHSIPYSYLVPVIFEGLRQYLLEVSSDTQSRGGVKEELLDLRNKMGTSFVLKKRERQGERGRGRLPFNPIRAQTTLRNVIVTEWLCSAACL
jgi:hypothetical protein